MRYFYERRRYKFVKTDNPSSTSKSSVPPIFYPEEEKKA
jgi:hypothetical protein